MLADFWDGLGNSCLTYPTFSYSGVSPTVFPLYTASGDMITTEYIFGLDQYRITKTSINLATGMRYTQNQMISAHTLTSMSSAMGSMTAAISELARSFQSASVSIGASVAAWQAGLQAIGTGFTTGGGNAMQQEFNDPAIEPEFYTEAVLGSRSFDVDNAGWLRGIFYPDIWLPGENVAKCWEKTGAVKHDKYDNWTAVFPMQRQWYKSYAYSIAQTDGKDIAYVSRFTPSEIEHDMHKCRHGFYAYNEGSNDFRGDGMVSAIIEGYGLVCVGSRGFKASKAKVLALCFDTTPKDPYSYRSMDSHEDEPLPTLSKSLREKVMANYPDIPIYPNFGAMIAEFPPAHFKDTEEKSDG